ncbi:MAG: mercuric reductase [Gemmatimonadota bacterium]|nr:MAG: mercuric reductase [Gemmatimonadota bacterium]
MTADVIIIGSGQAGAPLAYRLSRAAKRVILFEGSALGGTCVNVGCTPTKTFIASADAAHWARRGPEFGVETGEVRIDMAAVVARKNKIVEMWRSGVERNVEKHAENLTLVREHARLLGPGLVGAGGEEYRADTIIVNVGLRPSVPPIPGLEQVPYLTNEDVMDLAEVPDHLIVLGGGYIGCEFGQAYRRFGAEVSIVDLADHLIPREDHDVTETLAEVFEQEGIRLHLGARAERIEATDAGVRVHLEGSGVIDGSHLLVAVGRAPNTDSLGCDETGVELDQRGYIVVDDHYHTSVPGIYAVGDVTGGPLFTHASWDDHRILFDLLEGNQRRTRKDRLVPSTAFTDPQLARVGLTEREAEEAGLDYEVATMPFGRVARAVETRQPSGMMKVLVDPDTEKILGAVILGAQAGELIHIFSMIMQAGATLQTIVDAEMVHPTFAEGLQTLVMRLDRYALS